MKFETYERVEILDAGSEGKAVARVNDRVIFVPFVVPGDVVDIRVVHRKKSYAEGKAIKFHRFSEKRQETFCEHFGTCGGCRWQNMRYEDQLFYKQKQVEDNFQRIGKIEKPVILSIIPSKSTIYYRNKLEFTFSNRRWMTESDKATSRPEKEMNALGFHLPLLFDRVLDIHQCFLQKDPSNDIRLEARKYALDHGLTFYDARTWQGLLRNLLIRTSESGDLMVILVFSSDEKNVIPAFLDHLMEKFPAITSLYYVINPKKNDVITDLSFYLYRGKPAISEFMPDHKSGKKIEFRIGPASFFQTNSAQAQILYRTAADFADFTGGETVYDLYTGIGTISNYIAASVKKAIGIESIPAAVEDAKENSRLNGITNTQFFAGEAEKILTPGFIAEKGTPNVVITDPPRAGMHEKVVRTLVDLLPEKIVYVSCNPATQARDISLMKDHYTLIKCRPVDMFPHTQHVENVALLQKTG